MTTNWDVRLQQVRWIGGAVALLIALAMLVKPELGHGATGIVLVVTFCVFGLPAGLATMLAAKPFWERLR